MRIGRRSAFFLTAAVLVAASIALADFDQSMWPNRWSVGPSPDGGLVGFVLPADAYKSARADLADLRIVADDGTEVQFDLWTDPPAEKVSDVAAEQLEVKRGEEFRIVTMDTGELEEEGQTSPIHSRVVIKTTTKNFWRGVNVEASRGQDLWDNLRTQVFLFSMVEGGRTVEHLRVDYPPSKHRFVRLSLVDPEAEILAGIEGKVQNVDIHEGRVAVVYEGPARSRTEQQTKETVVTVDLEGPVPHNRIEVVSQAARFARWAIAEESDDSRSWRFLAARVIDRRALTAMPGGPADGDWGLDFPESSARYLRVRVRNLDEPPIEFTGVKVQALERVVQFSAQKNVQYWLYAGNPDANLRSFTARRVENELPTAGVIAVGRTEPNPTYGVEPGLEIPPFVIVGIAGLLVVVVLIVIVVLKKRKKKGPKPKKDPDLDIKF